MGFTKLDEGILKSSIMGETAEVFKVWIVFLASCGPDGIARVTAIFLSGVCHFPIDVVRSAIKRLEAPDLESRTEKEEGRRIIKVEGGWFIVNYEKYRSFSNSESPGAIRTRKWRERKRSEEASLFKEDKEGEEHHGDVTDCTVTSRSASASASASISFKGRVWEGITEDDKRGWGEAYPACDVSIELARMREWLIANPKKAVKSNWRRFITNWLSRSQDRGGTNRTVGKRGEDADAAIDRWAAGKGKQ